MNLYVISGLCADSRVFRNIRFDTRLNVIHIPWIGHEVNESLEDYSRRMSKYIDKNQPYSILGLSFGGIVAAEIAKLLHPKSVVFISSLKSSYDMPLYFKIAYKLRIYKLIPMKRILTSKKFIQLIFGIDRDKKNNLFNELIDLSNPSFVKWAIRSIISWDNRQLPKKYLHLHGGKDLVFPFRYLKNEVIEFRRASHFMVFTNGKSVSEAINNFLLKDEAL